ncbi:MAG TPA: lipoyl(octanoyl) transferase LipB [Nitrososphaerales archaeon]|nr:lipoyl(octanoyl) transferase LipB [Nitrososphaerales archaeon]
MTGNVFDLGTVDYGEALGLQRRLVKMRTEDRIPDTLLLLEHDHVITLGRKTSAPNLKPQSIPVYEVERGGDATYHGPGQLVGYLIFRIEDHDVRRFVSLIEEAIIGAVGQFGIAAGRLDGHRGVWVTGKKLASIGVAVSGWVSYHGFALNVNTDLSYFDLIRPCGLDPAAMTSMAMVLGRRVDVSRVRDEVSRQVALAFGEAFGSGDLRAIMA